MTGSKGEDILTHFLHSSLSVCNVCAYENSCETHDQFTYNVYGTFKLHKKDSLLICISNINPTTQICCDLAQFQKM